MPTDHAVAETSCDTQTRLHRSLAAHLRDRLAPRSSAQDAGYSIQAAAGLRCMLEAERAAVHSAAALAPHDASGFLRWFEGLAHTGPGQGDPLFRWLGATADNEAMRWFISQELAGEAGFDDLVALALVRMPARAKMEMARNLWDEFGRGNPAGTHGGLLRDTARLLGIEPRIDASVWEALALSNLLAGLVVERLSFHAIGALGVIELTAPGRVALVARGMRRLGMPAEARRYFELHAAIDVEHSRRWNDEVIGPLVESDPSLAALIAEGALMRLSAGSRCYGRYRRELLGN